MDASFRWHDDQELDPGLRRDDERGAFAGVTSAGFRRDYEVRTSDGRVRDQRPRKPAHARASAPICPQSFAANAVPGTIHEPPTVITFGNVR